MLDKSPRPTPVNVPNDLAAHWMPFTANRAFKKNPRLLAGAKDMHYFTVDGRKLIDAAAGMWCTNAGHGRTQPPTPPDHLTSLEGRADQDRRLRISSVMAGRTSCMSPTTAYVARVIIGASGSVLIARITFELAQPAQCWIAPEMPQGT